MQLYSYYRSSASYRVRIALNYKQLPYEIIGVDLINNKQLNAEYRQHNKQGRVPTLVDGNMELGQSAAILEYLEEKYPQPPLLPPDLQARAWIRYVSQIIVSDMHPLNNVSAINFLKTNFKHTQEEAMQWYYHWLKQGFDTLEVMIAASPNKGKFCWGDQVTLADVCLVPQIFNANRFNFPMQDYPTLMRINDYCLQQNCFDTARPEKQPDCTDRSATMVP